MRRAAWRRRRWRAWSGVGASRSTRTCCRSRSPSPPARAHPRPCSGWSSSWLPRLLLVLPSLVFVFRLDQQSRLEVNPLEIHMSQNGSIANASCSPHVVVVGGGFGGVAAAKGLKDVPVRVTLVDKTNYHLFQPLLYQVATGILEPGTITTPIRVVVPQPEERRRAHGRGDRRSTRTDGWCSSTAAPNTLTYDYLVLATGVHGSYFGHDEWAPLAPSMKTLADAEFLRRRIIGALEQADQDRRSEAPRAVADVRAGRRGTHRLRAGRRARGALPPRADRVPPHRSAASAHHPGRSRAARAGHVLGGAVRGRGRQTPLAGRGRATRQGCGAGGCRGRRDRRRTRPDPHRVVDRGCCGVASRAAGWVSRPTAPGRVVVGPDLTVAGYPEIFVVGDTAHIENDGKVLPGVAQVALQSGKHAAHTIRARVLHQPPPGAFAYFDKGNMATISVTYAIMEKGKLKVGGLLGKAGWAFIHVLYLGRAEGQLMFILQGLFGVLLGRTGSRYIDTPSVEPPVAAAEAERSGELHA